MRVGDTVIVNVPIGDRHPPLTGVIVATEFPETPRIRRHSVRLDGGNGNWGCGTEKHPNPYFFQSDLVARDTCGQPVQLQAWP